MTGLNIGVSAIALLLFQEASSSAQSLPLEAPGKSDKSAVVNIDPEEIVVTANKREQNLLDVGLAVSVIQGSTFKDKQINSLADIAQSLPGLSFTKSAENSPIYTLRGVSFYETSLGALPAVSIYTDEVVLPFPALATHTAYDLERVEVLKGPQGTLFGSNSTGGAINFIAAKPTQNLDAGGQLTLGRFNQIIGEGYLSGAVSKNLLGRIALRGERADPWQQSDTRPNGPDGKNGRIKNLMGRILLDWQAIPGTRFQLNLNGWVDRSDPQAAQLVGFQNVIPLSPAENIAKSNLRTPTSRSADWTPGSLYGFSRQLQGSVRADIDLAMGVTLTSLSSYTTYRQRLGSDLDGSPALVGGHGPNTGRVNAFYQELRISNDAKSPFRYVVGVNFDRNKVDQYVDYAFGDSATGARNGITTDRIYGLQRFRDYAAFANFEASVTPTITLKAGARYSRNKVTGKSCSYNDNVDSTSTGAFIYRAVLRGAFGPYPSGACFSVNNLGVVNNGVAPGAPGQFAGVLSEDSVSWRTGIDWKLDDDVLFYLNAAKGFKSGSFPTASASAMSGYLAVKQESVLSFEGGVKASSPDRKLQASIAAFYYKYNDKQLRAKRVDPTFGIVDALQNIPKSSVRGIELEGSILPFTGLTIPFSATLLKARIDKFIGINGVGQAGDFAGTEIPYTPKLQLAISPELRIKLGSGTSGFFAGDVTYRSDTIAVVGGRTNSPVAFPTTFLANAISAYTLVDLRAGLDLPSDLRISVYGKNIFNKYYWTNVFLSSDTTARYAGQPRTYGISLSAKFK